MRVGSTSLLLPNTKTNVWLLIKKHRKKENKIKGRGGATLQPQHVGRPRQNDYRFKFSPGNLVI